MKIAAITTISILMVIFLALNASAVSNKLDINKVTIDIDGDQEFSGSGSSGTIHVQPDTEMEFEMRVENTWDRDSDDAERIQEIIADATLYEIDDGDDLTYSSSRFDLRAEGYKTIRWDWDIPEDVEDDQNYELEITVRGYDENGELHEDDMVINVEVERNSHEVVFKDIDVSDPSPCSEFAKIRVGVENKGDNDEEVQLTVESDYRGQIYEKEFDVEDSYSDDNEHTVTRTIDVSDWPEGRYTIDFLIEYEDEEITESETLRIPECWEKTADRDDDRDDTKDEDDRYVSESYDRQRSRNVALFRQLTSDTEPVKVEYDNAAYVPPLESFEPQNKNKGTDWGFVALIVANIVLFLVVIVGLGMLAIHFFEL